MSPARSLLYAYSTALVLCLNADAFVPNSNTRISHSASTLRYKSAKSDQNEIKDDNKMIKTEELQFAKAEETVEKKMDKKIDPTSQMPLDKYHFTTKSNKELIFDERTGRFFETSIRPGSLHQLWQEYLHEEGKASAPEPAPTNNFSNDMVPTEVLFGTSFSSSESSSVFEEDEEEMVEECFVHTPYQDSCESTPWNVLDDESNEVTTTKKRKGNKPNSDPGWSPPTIVDKCYEAWNRRDFAAAAECFTSSTTYKDYQYLGRMTTRQQLQDHFAQQANLLPPNCQIVVDHLAYDERKGKIATQWHVERKDGSNVQFTKGCSFYTLDRSLGLIKSGYRVSEMAVKPNRDTVNALLSLAPSNDSSSVSNSNNNSVDQQSVVERYFDAWNQRDMETALDCLTDDCVYQTEDPVFVGTLAGKDEMREHLVQNADVLPAAAKIILDDIAVDSFGQCTIGTRWHLEVNGVALPNLQGCSMYTTDPATGKIKTALDITEAPVKLPREALSFLWAPAVALFDQN